MHEGPRQPKKAAWKEVVNIACCNFVESALHSVRQLMLLLLMHRLNNLEERVMRVAARKFAQGDPV